MNVKYLYGKADFCCLGARKAVIWNCSVELMPYDVI